MATILVVDDEEPVRGFLAMLLADNGHDVRLATDGAQALEIVKAERVDLVLSDVMMAGVNGRELCRRLKADARTSSIPVILMTSAGPGATDGTGADGYLAKPFAIRDLEAMMYRWLPDEPPQLKAS